MPPSGDQGNCIWPAARSGYLPPCGGGRLARVAREPGGGCGVRRIKQVPPSPSLPTRGEGDDCDPPGAICDSPAQVTWGSVGAEPLLLGFGVAHSQPSSWRMSARDGTL